MKTKVSVERSNRSRDAERNSLEHRRNVSGHTGSGCSEDKHLWSHPGTGRTGRRTEPGGRSHSPSLTPVGGRRDTCRRGWAITGRLPSPPETSAAARQNSLVVDEKVPVEILRVWGVGGVAVLQNQSKV